MAQADSKACDHDMPTRRAVMTALAVSAVSMTPVPGSGFIHEQREAGVHMAQTVETLLRENTVSLASPTQRSVVKNIARLWAEDGCS